MKDNAEWQGFQMPDRSKRHRNSKGEIVDGDDETEAAAASQ